MDRFNNHLVVARNNAIFDATAKQYGLTSSAVKWDDQQTQYFRFYELIKPLDLNDNHKTLLDIGCGNGELFKFLNFLGYRGQYIGFDINKSLISQAQKRFPKIEFQIKDIMADKINGQFDYVVMSGLFNTNVDQSFAWTKEFAKKMFSLTKEIMAFNAISTHVSYKDKTIYYLSPAQMLEFCIKELTPRITLTHHNLPYNYTLIAYKNHSWQSVNKES